MAQGTRTLRFYSMLLGNTLDIHVQFLKRLRQRLQLTEVHTGDNCDVIIAFVPIMSRAGMDIEVALQKIPITDKNVILVGLHFTFDENYVTPSSERHVNRSDVFAVDLLCYEDLGILRSLRNDQALKAVTDHLISIGGLPSTQMETTTSERPCSPFVFVCICIIFIIAVAIAVGFSIYLKKWQNHITPTPQPNNTINTAPLN